MQAFQCNRKGRRAEFRSEGQMSKDSVGHTEEFVLHRMARVYRLSYSMIKSKREKQISYINAYIWNLENGIDDLICKAKIETQT